MALYKLPGIRFNLAFHDLGGFVQEWGGGFREGAFVFYGASATNKVLKCILEAGEPSAAANHLGHQITSDVITILIKYTHVCII